MEKLRNAFLTLFPALFLVLTACNSSVETAKTGEAKAKAALPAFATSYQIDTVSSMVNWKGSELIGSTHTGTIHLKEGVIATEHETIIGGSLVLKMNSLAVTDLSGSEKDKLESHLKNKDFFNVAKHPIAKFEISGVSPYTDPMNQDTAGKWITHSSTHTVTGNLFLNDSVKSVVFPAAVKIDSTNIKATAKLAIDRTLWGLHYATEKSLGNKVISNELLLEINLVGKKR